QFHPQVHNSPGTLRGDVNGSGHIWSDRAVDFQFNWQVARFHLRQFEQFGISTVKTLGSTVISALVGAALGLSEQPTAPMASTAMTNLAKRRIVMGSPPALPPFSIGRRPSST